MDDVSDRSHVFDVAKEVGRLNQYAGRFVVYRFVERFQIDAAILAVVYGQERHALVPGIGGDHLAVLGMHAGSNYGLVAAGYADSHHQSLGRAGGAVVHRRVGDIHAGQLADHRLKLEDGLQRALGNLRLIRGVSREELAA